jgi:hypothetical protein
MTHNTEHRSGPLGMEWNIFASNRIHSWRLFRLVTALFDALHELTVQRPFRGWEVGAKFQTGFGPLDPDVS